MIAYTVTCELDDEASRDSWVEWLVKKNIAEGCAAGASDAEGVKLDGTSSCIARHQFATREDFDAYIEHHAPRLRAEGLAHAPKGGVRFQRNVGEVVERIRGA